MKEFPRRVRVTIKRSQKNANLKEQEALNAQNVIEALKIVEEYKAKGLVPAADLTPEARPSEYLITFTQKLAFGGVNCII